MGHVTAGRPGARFRRGGIERRPTLDSGVRSRVDTLSRTWTAWRDDDRGPRVESAATACTRAHQDMRGHVVALVKNRQTRSLPEKEGAV